MQVVQRVPLRRSVSFRVTQVVDVVRGVHPLIPKTVFAPQLRREMTIV
jgi:hypothetical protein